VKKSKKLIYIWLVVDVFLVTPTTLRANVSPSDIILSGASVRECQPRGMIVGILKAVDQDMTDTHTFSLVPGPGSEDNSLFFIRHDTLRTAATFDFAVRNRCNIRIRAEDSQGATTEKQFHGDVMPPSFVATVQDYFAMNGSVQQASIAQFDREALDYFWAYLNMLASIGRISMETPANMPTENDADEPRFIDLSATEVTRVLSAKTAHAIWIDLNRLVPWCLADYAPDHLSGLFDRNVLMDVSSFNVNQMYVVVDCSPSEVWQYAIGHNLLRGDIYQTVAAVVEDLRSDFVHGSSNTDPKTVRSLRAALDDYSTRSNGLDCRVSWNGCHSMTRIFLGLLRAMNIPGYITAQGEYFVSGHSEAVLPCIERVLMHGDDIYSGSSRAIPASLLMAPFQFFADNANAPPTSGDKRSIAARYDALLATEYPSNVILDGVRNPSLYYGGTPVGFLAGYAGWDLGLTSGEPARNPTGVPP
jgi:hypothetical protein